MTGILPGLLLVIALATLFAILIRLVRVPAARDAIRRTAAPRVVAFAGFALIVISAWIPPGTVQGSATGAGLGLLLVAVLLALRYWTQKRSLGG